MTRWNPFSEGIPPMCSRVPVWVLSDLGEEPSAAIGIWRDGPDGEGFYPLSGGDLLSSATHWGVVELGYIPESAEPALTLQQRDFGQLAVVGEQAIEEAEPAAAFGLGGGSPLYLVVGESDQPATLWDVWGSQRPISPPALPEETVGAG